MTQQNEPGKINIYDGYGHRRKKQKTKTHKSTQLRPLWAAKMTHQNEPGKFTMVMATDAQNKRWRGRNPNIHNTCEHLKCPGNEHIYDGYGHGCTTQIWKT